MSKRKRSHLVIPDAHAVSGYDNKRFSALGKYIVSRRPDVIVCIGDFADMASLSSYDKGKLSYEGRAYQKDIDAALDAQEKLLAPIAKAKGYSPELIMTLGNHEDRIDREVNNNPGLYGKLSMDDLEYKEHGWKVSPFLQPVTVDGITYAHYFVSGVASRPISGENIGKTLCTKLHSSAVQGHSHVFDHAERAIISGKKIFGLSCGCYTHPGQVEGWNRATVSMWWRGVVELMDLDDQGYYDQLVTTTQRKLLRDFA